MEATDPHPALLEGLKAHSVADRMITDELLKQFEAAGMTYLRRRSGPRDAGRPNRHCVVLTTDPRTGKPVPPTHDLTFHYTKGYRLVRTSGAR